MGECYFRPPQCRNPLTDLDGRAYLKYITTHRRPSTMQNLVLIRRRGWSGRIASLPLFWCLSYFFFFCFLRLAYKSRRRMKCHRSTLSRRVLLQGYAFWVLEYLVFRFYLFYTKIVKSTPKWAISSQNAETWNTRYFGIYETERRENLTQSWEHKAQFSDAIWWRHSNSKMADGRHIENRFWLYFGAILAG